MKQRKWTAEEKVAIVLEGLKGQKTIAEICREREILKIRTTNGGISS